MQRELVARQNLTGSFAQPDRADREDEQRRVESKAHDKNHPAGHQTHRGAHQEFFEIRRRRRMQVDLEIPAQRQQRKQPNIITPQTPPDRLPDADRKVRRQQVRREMRSPLLIARHAVRRQHLRQVTGFHHAHAAGPDFVIAITSRFHHQKDRY